MNKYFTYNLLRQNPIRAHTKSDLPCPPHELEHTAHLQHQQREVQLSKTFLCRPVRRVGGVALAKKKYM